MTEDLEKRSFHWNAITSEIAFRRERRWKIFSWSTALQILIAGGIITLRTDPQRVGLFNASIKLAVFIGASAITLCSVIWIRQNYAAEVAAKARLEECDEQLVLKSYSIKGPGIGYWHVLVLLYTGICILLIL